MNKKITVLLSNHTAGAIRYSAYTQTADFWVYIAPSETCDNALDVFFSSKNGGSAEIAGQKFLAELEDEKIREKNRRQNIATSEMLIREAMNKFRLSFVREEQPALSAAQEQELDALIAEVEKELQEEMNSSRTEDPQHITRTWEENNKNGR